ncbi:ABC transporter family substrate-binding protein [Streptomyces sp. TRM 70351]|uniref:ABC transporter family substrate-binding protein n=1 Tax=Streptomyces sp. TRM 70351 TaxID=3116552 RepID=UPI002E7C3800|nr:ABC transporter family substrate-binding protein [Streptomyces sp. TRM 70351]MEE1927751.1 ABC transporter family substrate-binding protein [Streptomyces sp. TRM 70351]
MPAVPAAPPAPAVPAAPDRRTATRPRAAVLAAFLLLPCALTGCGAEEDSGEGKSGAARDLSVAARDQVRDGGVLRWAVETAPSTLNAFHDEADATTDRIAGATLPALFTVDSRGRPQLNTDVLESAEVTEREPQQKVVYTLHPEARWSDGRRVGAADFQAQWKALSGADNAFWAARNTGYDQVHKVAEGPGPREVEVTFARPFSDWKSLFTPLYPESVTGEPEAFNDTSRTSLPVAAGPFRVEDGTLDPGADAVTLERNPKWWGETAKLDAIVLTAVPRKERARALAAGRVDLAEIRPSTAERIAAAKEPASTGRGAARGDAGAKTAGGQDATEDADAEDAAQEKDAAKQEDAEKEKDGGKEEKEEGAAEKKDGGAAQGAETGGGAGDAADTGRRNLRQYAVRRAYAPVYLQLALNGSTGPLRDERVRRAVARALDREALAAAALGPAGLDGRALGSHLRMYDQAGYQDGSTALGEPGPASAAALLASAGWRGGPPADAGPGAGADAGPDGSPFAVTAPVLTGLTHSAATGHAAVLRQTAHAQTRAARAAGKDGDDDAARRRKAAEAAREKAAEATEALDRVLGGLLRAEGGSLVRAREGEKLELRLVLPAGDRTSHVRRTGDGIARMLRRVGVDVRITRVPDAAFLQDHVVSGDFDLALYSWPATAFPVTDTRPVFAKPVVSLDGALLIEQNYTRVGTDQIDQLFEEAAGELDEDARADLVRRIDARLWAAAGSLPLYQHPQLVAVDRRLANAGAFGLQTPRYQDIGFVRRR